MPDSWTLLLNGTPQSHVDLADPTRLEFEYAVASRFWLWRRVVAQFGVDLFELLLLGNVLLGECLDASAELLVRGQ